MSELRSVELARTGRPVHYYRAGLGAPLLYLHGVIGTTGWEPVIAALAEQFDVIAPYHPGWGPAKDQLPDVSTVLDLVLHYDDLFDALEISAAHVVGISVGAWIGAELAAIMRHRVNRLALVNPLGIWDNAHPGEDFFAQSPGAPTAVQFANASDRQALLVRDRDPVEAMVQEALDLRAAAKFLWPIPDTGIDSRIGRVRAPVMVVGSEKDRIVTPPVLDRWAFGLGGCAQALLANAGHAAHLEQPAALADVASGFLSDNSV